MKETAFDADVDGFILIKTGKPIHSEKTRHIMARLLGFKIGTGIPPEEDWVQSDFQDIDAYFERLESILVDFPADMVLNLDETGHFDWVEQRQFDVHHMQTLAHNRQQIVCPFAMAHLIRARLRALAIGPACGLRFREMQWREDVPVELPMDLRTAKPSLYGQPVDPPRGDCRLSYDTKWSFTCQALGAPSGGRRTMSALSLL
jgi:hypothetical protein